MGILGSAGDAVENVTKKATENPAGDLIDAVAGDLAGNSGGAASGSVAWVQGAPLDADTGLPDIAAESENVGSPLGKGPAHNAARLSRKLQFLHFGFAHDDRVDNFEGKAGASHGIAFRAALIREAVLIHSFARGAQTVLKDAKDSKGAAGALLATAGSLLGGDKQAAAGPEAIDPILDAIRTAANKINVDAVTYPDIHQAGRDLAKAWADLGATCQTALDPSKGGGMGLPTLPGSNVLASAGGLVAQIPKWLFKAQDCYMAMFREARTEYEWPIMKVCHEYSTQAIKDRHQPDYDIWFLPKPDAAGAFDGEQTGAEKSLKDAQDGLESLPDFAGGKPAGDVAGALRGMRKSITEARTGARDTAGDITGWLATAESAQAGMPPGSAEALAKAVAVLKGNVEKNANPQRDPPIEPLVDVVIRGLKQGLGDGVPDTLRPFVKIACDITIYLLPRVYAQVHGRYGIPHPSLTVAAVHDAIASRIVEMVWALIPGAGPVPGSNDARTMENKGRQFGEGLLHGDADTGDLPGVKEAKNKAADVVRGFIASQAHYLDAIVLFIAEDLTNAMVPPYVENAGLDTLSMEACLGRLPQHAALLVRNLIFPVFNLLMKAFGMGDALAGLVWNPVDDSIKQVTEVAQDVKDTKDQIQRGGKNVNQAAHDKDDQLFGKDDEDGDIQPLMGATQDDVADGGATKSAQANKLLGDIRKTPDEMREAATRGDDKTPAPGPDKPSGTGPLSDKRKADGEAQPVKKADLDKAGRVDATDEPTAKQTRKQAPPPPSAAPKERKAGDWP